MKIVEDRSWRIVEVEPGEIGGRCFVGKDSSMEQMRLIAEEVAKTYQANVVIGFYADACPHAERMIDFDPLTMRVGEFGVDGLCTRTDQQRPDYLGTVSVRNGKVRFGEVDDNQTCMTTDAQLASHYDRIKTAMMA